MVDIFAVTGANFVLFDLKSVFIRSLVLLFCKCFGFLPLILQFSLNSGISHNFLFLKLFFLFQVNHLTSCDCIVCVCILFSDLEKFAQLQGEHQWWSRFFNKIFLPYFGRWDANVMTLLNQLTLKQITNPQNITA